MIKYLNNFLIAQLNTVFSPILRRTYCKYHNTEYVQSGEIIKVKLIWLAKPYNTRYRFTSKLCSTLFKKCHWQRYRKYLDEDFKR